MKKTKKQDRKEIDLYNRRIQGSPYEKLLNLNNTNDEDLKNYNNLKEQLRLN